MSNWADEKAREFFGDLYGKGLVDGLASLLREVHGDRDVIEDDLLFAVRGLVEDVQKLSSGLEHRVVCSEILSRLEKL